MPARHATRFPSVAISQPGRTSSCAPRWCVIALVAACAAAPIPLVQKEARAQLGPPPPNHPNVREVQRLLGEPIDLDFKHTSLENVLKYIGAVKPGLRLTIDPEVQRAGTDLSNRVIDIRARGITVASALNLLLGGDLSYLVQLDGLVITTRKKVVRHLSAASYPVADLLGRMAGNAGETVEAVLEQLADLIMRHVNSAAHPYMADWEVDGGSAGITYQDGSLTITQTATGHEHVAALLKLVDRALAPGVTKAARGQPEALVKTRARLAETIDLDFEHTSLDNVLMYISEVKRGLNIVTDPDLTSEGIDLSTRVVDLKVKGVSIEAVLSLILGEDLTYRVESGYVLVTTRRKAWAVLWLLAYRVEDLLPKGQDQMDSECEYELMEIIQRNVNNMSDPNVAHWTDEGGAAYVDFLGGLLVITQTHAGHEHIADLLEMLRRALAPGAPDAVTMGSKALQQTRELLANKVDLDFEHTSLDNVLKYISEVERGLNIVTDPDLQAQGIDLSTRVVDLKVKGVSVELVMNLILGEDLGYVVGPGYVLITTLDKKHSHLPTVAYAVKDLLGPDRLTGAPTDRTAWLEALHKAVNNKNDPAVAPWVSEGGWAAMDLFGDVLVVTQAYEGHQRVSQYLENLRRTGGSSDR